MRITPHEQAKELQTKYLPLVQGGYLNETYHNKAKQCALIAVELHLDELSKMKLIFSDREIIYKYWKEVKTEIEKL